MEIQIRGARQVRPIQYNFFLSLLIAFVTGYIFFFLFRFVFMQMTLKSVCKVFAKVSSASYHPYFYGNPYFLSMSKKKKENLLSLGLRYSVL